MTGQDWASMDPTQFDRTLGTPRERRLIAKLRAEPDTLLPDFGKPELTPRPTAHWADPLPDAPPVVDGQEELDIFGGEA